MITFMLKYSDDEIEGFFRKHGCQITTVTTVKHVPAYHNKTREEQVTTVCVVNPFSSRATPIRTAFEQVMDSIVQQFFIADIDRLKVLNALKSMRNE